MQRIKITGLAILAVLALSAVAASAASAHAFHAKLPAGKTFPQAVSGEGKTQTFKSGFGTITCEMAKSKSEATAAEVLVTKVLVEYLGGCKDNVGDPVTNEPIHAEYDISADQLVSILAPIVIQLGGFASCSITISTQEKLGGITFKNNAAKTELTLESKTSKIKQTGSGGFCTNGEGEYTGNVTSKLVNGGELWWE